MNNDEKILEMLEALTKGQEILAKSQEALTKGQADMQSDIADLKEGQAKIEATQSKLEARVEDIHTILAVMEVENKQAHGGIFEKIDDFQTKAEESTDLHMIIDESLANHDLRLIRLENKAFGGRQTAKNN